MRPRGRRASRVQVAGRAQEPEQAPERAERWPRALRGILVLVLLLLALGAVVPEVVWQHQVFVAADFDAPSDLAAAGDRARAAGTYPLWNPYLFLGMPSFGSLSYTPWVFPPSQILAVLGKIPGVAPLAWLIVYYLFAGAGVFVLLRALRAGYWASLSAATAFALTPHLISMGVFGHGSKLASVAFLPWVLWASVRMAARQGQPRWIGALALLLGLLFLRGHPQIAWYALLMLGVHAAVEITVRLRQVAERRAGVRLAGAYLASVVLGFGMATVLLLPVRAYAPESIRGASAAGGAQYAFATGWSMSPSEVASFILPSAVGFGEGTYVGSMPFTNYPHYLGQVVVLFGLAALAWLRCRLLWTLFGIGVLALLVSFGSHFPLVYDVFYKFVPYFNKFRVPVMMLVLLQLAACIAAGMGLSALWGRLPAGCRWRRGPDARTGTRLAVAAGLLAVVLLVVVGPWGNALERRVAGKAQLPVGVRGRYAEVAKDLVRGDGLRLALVLAGIAGMTWLVARRKVDADVAGLVVLGLTVFDLAAVDRRMVHPEGTWPGLAPRVVPASRDAARHDAPGPLVAFLSRQTADAPAPPRILPLGEGFTSNRWMRYGIASVGGYHPAKPARFQRLLDANALQSQRVLDVLGVRYLVAARRFSGGPPPVYEGPDGVVYENPGAFPRAWVVGRVRETREHDCPQQLTSGSEDLRRVALLEPPVPAGIDSTASGTARILEYEANRIVLEVESSAPALVVVSEAWSRGWQAEVDGTPQPVHVADCVLRAVAVPGGTCRVVLRYHEPALRAGLWISSICGVVALTLLGIGAAQEARAARSARDVAPGAEVAGV